VSRSEPVGGRRHAIQERYGCAANRMIKWLILNALLQLTAALVAADAMSGASYSASLSGIEFLLSPVLVPYLVFWVISSAMFAIRALRRYIMVPACATSSIMLVFTILVYSQSSLASSSTGVLVFLYAPFWLFVGSGLSFVLGIIINWLILWLLRPKDKLRCPKCGYLLFGLVEPRCPECATEFDPALLHSMQAAALTGGIADSDAAK
jgi:hypothetical protein